MSYMYNKLFTKILDSSIWLEPDATRIVWMTLIAAMDEDGFVQFASVANLAHRARVTLEDAKKAVLALESPDENSSDPDNEGRRLERVDGGWIILNATKYRELVTRTVAKEQTRRRVAKYREKKRSGNGDVTECNGKQAGCNGDVTPSEACTAAITESDTKSEAFQPPSQPKASPSGFEEFWAAYPRRVAKANAMKAWTKLNCNSILPQILTAVRRCKSSQDWTKDGGQFIPHPATWLNRSGWEDELQQRCGSGIQENLIPHIE
jgi:hypothetical protein